MLADWAISFAHAGCLSLAFSKISGFHSSSRRHRCRIVCGLFYFALFCATDLATVAGFEGVFACQSRFSLCSISRSSCRHKMGSVSLPAGSAKLFYDCTLLERWRAAALESLCRVGSTINRRFAIMHFLSLENPGKPLSNDWLLQFPAHIANNLLLNRLLCTGKIFAVKQIQCCVSRLVVPIGSS